MFNRKLEKRIKELEDSVALTLLTKREVESCGVCGCLLLLRNIEPRIQFVEYYTTYPPFKKYYCSVHKPPYDSVVLTAGGSIGYFKKLKDQMVNEKGKPIKKEKK